MIYVRVRADRQTDQNQTELWAYDVSNKTHVPWVTGRPGIKMPRWSPSGDRLAFLAVVAEQPQIHLYWPAAGRVAAVSRAEHGVETFSWSADGRRFAYMSRLPDEPKPMVQLPEPPEGADWAPKAVVVDRAMYRMDGMGFVPEGARHIFVMSSDGGAAIQLTTGRGPRQGPLVWVDDHVVFAANRNPDPDLTPRDLDLYAVSIADRSLRRLTDQSGPEFSPALSPDGRFLAYLGYEDEGFGYQQNRLMVLNLESGEQQAWLAEEDVSFEVVQPSDDGWVVGFARRGVGYVARAIGPDRMEVVADGVGVGGSARPYVGFGLQDAFQVQGQRMAFMQRTQTTPSEPHWIPRMNRKPQSRSRPLVRLNNELLERRVISPPVPGQTENGVQYWRILPPTSSPDTRTLPTILEIHGGPYASYGPVFSAELQLYASAGYMVLYANPRGSTSYGRAWADAIEKNYPGPDVEDLLEVVETEVAAGRVDDERVYVTGGSGGGVLSAWLVGVSNRFRAAVVAKPVINWTSFSLTADFSPLFVKYWFEEPPWENVDSYWKRSPLSNVGKVRTPTMLLTGEADLRTPISESEQFYQALRQREVETVMVRLPEASHGISRRPSHLVSKVGHILSWFHKHGGSGEAVAVR